MKDEWIDKTEMSQLVKSLEGRPVYGPRVDDLFDDMPFGQNQRPAPNPSAPPGPPPQAYQPPVYPQQPPVYPLQLPVYQQQPPVYQQQPPVYPQQPPVYQQPPPVYQQPPPVYQQQPPVYQQQPPVYQQAPPSEPAQFAKSTEAQPTATVPISSPFSLDEDELEFGEIEERIEHLASETEKALEALREARKRAEKNGLIARATPARDFAEPGGRLAPKDRIPLEAEIDPYLSLKGRLEALGRILSDTVGMTEMLVADRNGFVLFQTERSARVDQKVGTFLKMMNEIYLAADGRKHSASQFLMAENQWLCVLPSEGKPDAPFLLKILTSEPLDKPEIYVLIELFNEALRPRLD